jgi:beta-N-acetylhexosaminidase
MREAVRRVGQRFAVGFEGETASADLKAMLREFGVGAVVIFARNVAEPEQLAELVRELQALSRAAGAARPLLVAVDQEGGRVARLREPWTLWPPARALGRYGSERAAERQGQALASELSACGIRLDLAPVVDVDTNPKNPVIGDRSFGDDPELVAGLGAAFVRGLQSGGVAACAKHFPGHGDTALDSHHELPTVEHSRARLEEVELRPFRRVIEAGVASVMTGHLLVRELDDAQPATLSPAILEGVLRKELGFGGVVISDDLEMRAVARGATPARLAVKAALAGCDLLSFCQSHDAQAEAIEGLVRAVETGEVPFRAQEATEARLRAFGDRFLRDYRDPDPGQARLMAGRGEHRQLAEEIQERSGMTA